MNFLFDAMAIDYVYEHPEIMEKKGKHLFFISEAAFNQVFLGGPAVNVRMDGTFIWPKEKCDRMSKLGSFALANFTIRHDRSRLQFHDEKNILQPLVVFLGWNATPEYRAAYAKSNKTHKNKLRDIQIMEHLLYDPTLYLVSDDGDMKTLFNENGILEERLILPELLKEWL